MVNISNGLLELGSLIAATTREGTGGLRKSAPEEKKHFTHHARTTSTFRPTMRSGPPEFRACIVSANV
jgi:hypothetical protein